MQDTTFARQRVVNVVKCKKPLQDKWQVFAKHKKPYKAKPHRAKWQAQILLKPHKPQGKKQVNVVKRKKPLQDKWQINFVKRKSSSKFYKKPCKAKQSLAKPFQTNFKP